GLTTHPFGVAMPHVSILGEGGPIQTDELEAHGPKPGSLRHLEARSPRFAFSSAGSDLHWFASQAIRRHDPLLEGSDLDTQLVDFYCRPSPELRVETSTQPVCDCCDRHLVSPPRTETREIGIERTGLSARMVCRLTQHGPQLRRTLLRDMAMPVSVARL